MEQNLRAGVPRHVRNDIANRIMEALQRHSLLLEPDRTTELWKIANRFEEKIFDAASDQYDYSRRVLLKMLSLQTGPQDASNAAVSTGSSGTDQRPLDSDITEVQSWQQVVQPAQVGMSNKAIQGSDDGCPALSFSRRDNVPQPASAMNAVGQLLGNSPAVNGDLLSNYTSSRQAPSQIPHLQQQQQLAQLQQYLQQQYLHINLQQDAQLQRRLMQQFLQQQSMMQRFLYQQYVWRQSAVYQQSQAQVGSGDSSQQVGQAGGIDNADIVWSKMQRLKDKYLQDMQNVYDVLVERSQQHMPEEQLQKLTHYKNMLQQMLLYLIAKRGWTKKLTLEKVEALEKEIVSVMETLKQGEGIAPQPQEQRNLGQVQVAVQQPPQKALRTLQPFDTPVRQHTLKTNSVPQSINASFPCFCSEQWPPIPQPLPPNSVANASASDWIGNASRPTVSPKTAAEKPGTGKAVASTGLATAAATTAHLFCIFIGMLTLTYFLHLAFCRGMTT